MLSKMIGLWVVFQLVDVEKTAAIVAETTDDLAQIACCCTNIAKNADVGSLTF